jgi:hypothetical protein
VRTGTTAKQDAKVRELWVAFVRAWGSSEDEPDENPDVRAAGEAWVAHTGVSGALAHEEAYADEVESTKRAYDAWEDVSEKLEEAAAAVARALWEGDGESDAQASNALGELVPLTAEADRLSERAYLAAVFSELDEDGDAAVQVAQTHRWAQEDEAWAEYRAATERAWRLDDSHAAPSDAAYREADAARDRAYGWFSA